ncbi:MAG TPA: hypothetical protein VF281_02160 [Candidatus Saccharimonadales bacterium]
MEQGDNFTPYESEHTSREQSPELSTSFQRSRLARFVLEKLGRLSRRQKSEGEILHQEVSQEATDYTLDRFTIEQFERARIEFCAWYEVAQSPRTAAEHPLVIARFGDTLDPIDVAEIFEWWGAGVADSSTALEDTRKVIDAGLELNGFRVEKILSITNHVEGSLDQLYEALDESRLEEI